MRIKNITKKYSIFKKLCHLVMIFQQKEKRKTLCHIGIKVGWLYFFFSLKKRGYLVLSFHVMPHVLILKMDGCGLWGLIYGGGILIHTLCALNKETISIRRQWSGKVAHVGFKHGLYLQRHVQQCLTEIRVNFSKTCFWLKITSHCAVVPATKKFDST